MSAELKLAPAAPHKPVADNNAPEARMCNEANGTPSPWSRRTDRLLIVLGILLLITGALMFGLLEYSEDQSQASEPPLHGPVISNLTHHFAR
jgi:hypothetical protein